MSALETALDSCSGPRVLPAFLTPESRAALSRLAAQNARGWQPGRQGTGYEKLDLRALRVTDATLEAQSFGWDAFLLRYRASSFVPPHRDPVNGGRHMRLNAIIECATAGTGELRLDGSILALNVGDAVLFRPDLITHEVSQVAGERLMLSVGWVY